MKHLNLTVLILFLFVGSSCQKDKFNITSLEIDLSKAKILGDGIDNSTITAFDQNKNDVSSNISIFINGQASASKIFKSTSPGIYKISASYGSIKSDTMQCEVVADAGLKFQKPVLLEQYTGTWCGWCPRAIANIESIQTTDNNIVHIALHLSDAMIYFQNLTLFQSFGFQGIPTVHADRKTVWQGESNIFANLHTPSRAGLALEVSGNATEINAKVKAKFGNSFVDGLKISMYMVHDSLVSTQANYYNTDPTSKFYQKGDVMTGFVHRNVMIMTGLDMFGETVPKDSVEVGSTFSKSVTFRGFYCENIKNIKIIAFLTNSTGLKKGQVVNCIIARVGEKKEFATVTR